MLLDAAHNPDGARALAAYLRESGWTDCALIFGAMRDKAVARNAGAARARLPGDLLHDCRFAARAPGRGDRRHGARCQAPRGPSTVIADPREAIDARDRTGFAASSWPAPSS